MLGGSGFIGRAATVSLIEAGFRVRSIRAPRLCTTATAWPDILDRVRGHEVATNRLAEHLEGCIAVVNAAGRPDATSDDWRVLAGANTLLPAVTARAAASAGVPRLVHVSTMAVQGRRDVLDESLNYEPFSPYSRSKQVGEQALLAYAAGQAGGPSIVCLRPGSVHGPRRGTSHTLARFARSRARSVAGRGDRPSPQHLVSNVGDAIAELVVASAPPRVVIQPWEGITSRELLWRLSGREPHHVNPMVARAVVTSASALGPASAAARAWARRLELVWFGQRQATSWLTRSGFAPQHGPAAWHQLATEL